MRPCTKGSVLEKQEHVNLRRKLLGNIAVNLKADWFLELDCEVAGAKIGF
jgi:hypothetical protein